MVFPLPIPGTQSLLAALLLLLLLLLLKEATVIRDDNSREDRNIKRESMVIVKELGREIGEYYGVLYVGSCRTVTNDNTICNIAINGFVCVSQSCHHHHHP